MCAGVRQELSYVRLFAIPWTVAHQALLSMEFSRQEYWSGLPFPSPGDLPNPGIEPRSPALQAGSLPAETPGLSLGVWLLTLWHSFSPGSFHSCDSINENNKHNWMGSL